jgi:hypothetical protein
MNFAPMDATAAVAIARTYSNPTTLGSCAKGLEGLKSPVSSLWKQRASYARPCSTPSNHSARHGPCCVTRTAPRFAVPGVSQTVAGGDTRRWW